MRRTRTCRKSSGPSASCDWWPHGNLSKTEPEVPSTHIVRSPPALFERTSNRRMGKRTSSARGLHRVCKIGLPGGRISLYRGFARVAYGGGGRGGGGSRAVVRGGPR